MASRLTCDYCALCSHRAYGNLDILQDKDCARDKGGGAKAFSAALKMNENEKSGGHDEEESQREGGSSLLFKRLRVRSTMIPPGPLDMAALPVLNQSQRLQLMAKIRNNHRLPLIILN